jgi:ketosteroid isomerase-like protein
MHPSEELLTRAYECFGSGDMAGLSAMCEDDIEFVVPGTTPLRGRHTKADFGEWIGSVMQICRTFGERPIDVIANDAHGVVILDHWEERDGVRHDYRADHIRQIRNGKFVGFVERPGDEAQFNRIWS